MLPESLKCPECDGQMVSRLNRERQQRFWGCKRFPVCRGTRDVNGLSRFDKRDSREFEVYDEDGYDQRRYHR